MIINSVSPQGLTTVSNNILNGTGRLKWCIKEMPYVAEDTGWIFLSEIDDEIFLADASNFSVVSFDKVVELEPAVLFIYDLPYGTDIQLVIKKGKRFFVDSNSAKKIDLGGD